MRALTILARASLSLILCWSAVGCHAESDNDVSSGASSTRKEAPRGAHVEKDRASNTNVGVSLRQRIDAITLWPEIDRASLLPLLSVGTTFREIGSSSPPLRGKAEILNALKTLQDEANPWRVAASRGTHTASRIAVEIELLRCQDASNKSCSERRSALIFASLEGNIIKDVLLFQNRTWQPNSKRDEARRPVRWIGGRANPNLEKAFGKVWSGELESLLGDPFHFTDKATGREIRGKAAFIAHRARFAEFFPDGECLPQEIHSAGDIVIALSRCEGLFKRNVRGEGRKVTVHIADVARFHGSKLVELHSYSNHAEATSQLGISSEKRAIRQSE